MGRHHSNPNPPAPSRKATNLSVPAWQIPPGVTAANWDYVRSRSIATGYADFLSGDPLTSIDGRIVSRYLPNRDSQCDGDVPVVADFGCGNGRSLEPLLIRDLRLIGIDLSFPMLSVCGERLRQQASAGSKAPLLVQANLVQLEAFASDSIDIGLCLFSTLGMIQGREHRQSFLKHVRRMLKPEGRLVIHAHNAIYQLRHPGGWRWGLHSVWAHLRGRRQFGDRVADYRGVRSMFIHSFRRSELQADLQAAGFQPFAWHGIRAGCAEPVEPLPRWSDFRVVGWIVACQ